MRVRIEFADEHTSIDVVREIPEFRAMSGERLRDGRGQLLDQAMGHVRRALNIDTPSPIPSAGPAEESE